VPQGVVDVAVATVTMRTATDSDSSSSSRHGGHIHGAVCLASIPVHAAGISVRDKLGAEHAADNVRNMAPERRNFDADADGEAVPHAAADDLCKRRRRWRTQNAAGTYTRTHARITRTTRTNRAAARYKHHRSGTDSVRNNSRWQPQLKEDTSVEAEQAVTAGVRPQRRDAAARVLRVSQRQ
jgi:hypothetical protein